MCGAMKFLYYRNVALSPKYIVYGKGRFSEIKVSGFDGGYWQASNEKYLVPLSDHISEIRAFEQTQYKHTIGTFTGPVSSDFSDMVWLCIGFYSPVGVKALKGFGLFRATLR